MKRGMAIAAVLLALAVVAATVTGCSKEKTVPETEFAAVQNRVRELEAVEKDLREQLDKFGLKAAESQQSLKDEALAMETRLMHQPLTNIAVKPAAPVENGWLLIDGERTYTLQGFAGAQKVRFNWAPAGAGAATPELLGEDTKGSDGWSWTGTLRPGNMKALWAEVEYAGGVKVTSAVLPIRSPGK